jgi:chromosome segregation ATPase
MTEQHHMPDIDHGIEALTETTTPAELMRRRGQKTKLRTINKNKLRQWMEQAIAQTRAGREDEFDDREKEELLEKTQQQLEELMARAAHAEAAVQEREVRDAALQEEIETLRSRAADAESTEELNQALATIETLTRQREEAQNEADELRADLYQVQDQLNEKMTLLQTTIDEKDRLKTTMQELMIRAGELNNGVLGLDNEYYAGRHQTENELPEDAEQNEIFYHDYAVGAKIIETLSQDLRQLRSITTGDEDRGSQPQLLAADLELLEQLKQGGLHAEDVQEPVAGLIEALEGAREEALAQAASAPNVMGIGVNQQIISEVPDAEGDNAEVLAGATRVVRELAAAFASSKGQLQALKALADEADEARQVSDEDLHELVQANHRLIRAIVAQAERLELGVPDSLTMEDIPANERSAAGEALVAQFAARRPSQTVAASDESGVREAASASEAEPVSAEAERELARQLLEAVRGDEDLAENDHVADLAMALESDEQVPELADSCRQTIALLGERRQQLADELAQARTELEELRSQASGDKAPTEAMDAGASDSEEHPRLPALDSAEAATSALDEARQRLAELERERDEAVQERDEMAESGREVIQQLNQQKAARDLEIDQLRARVTALDHLNRAYIDAVTDMAQSAHQAVSEHAGEVDEAQLPAATTVLEQALESMPGDDDVPLSEDAAERMISATRTLTEAFKADYDQALGARADIAAGGKEVIEVLNQQKARLLEENQILFKDVEQAEAARNQAEGEARELAERVVALASEQADDEQLQEMVADLEASLSDDAVQGGDEPSYAVGAKKILESMRQVSDRRVRERLTELEAQLAQDQERLQTLGAEREQLQTQADQLHEQLAAAQGTRDSLQAELAELQQQGSQAQAAQTAVGETQEQLQQAEQERQVLAQQLAQAEAQRQELEDRLAQTEAARVEYEAQHTADQAVLQERADQREALQQAQDEAAQYSQQLEVAAKAAEAAEAKLEQAQVEIAELRETQEWERAQVEAAQASSGELEQRVVQAEQQVQQAQQQLDETAAEAATLRQQVEQLQADSEQVRGRAQESSAEVANLRERLDVAQRASEEAEESLQALQAEHQTARIERDRQREDIETELADLRVRAEEQDDRQEQLAEQLQAARVASEAQQQRATELDQECQRLREQLSEDQQALQNTREELETQVATANSAAAEQAGLQEQLQTAQDQLAELDALPAQLQAAQDQLAELDALPAQVRELTQSLQREQERAAELEPLTAQLAELEGSLRTERERVAELEPLPEQLRDLQADLERSRELIDELQQTESELRAGRQAMDEELAGLVAEKSRLDEELSAASAERDRFRILLREARAALEEYRVRDSETTGFRNEHVDELRKRLQRVQEEYDDAQVRFGTDLESLRIENTALLNRIEEQQQSIGSRDQQILDLKNQFDEIGDVRIDNKSLQAQVDNLAGEVESMQRRNQELEQQLDDLGRDSSRATGLREELDHLQSEREDLLSRVRSLEDDLAIERGRVGGLQEARDQLRESFDRERGRLQQSLREERQAHDEAMEQLRRLKSEVAGLQARVRSLTSTDDDFDLGQDG